MKLEKRGNRTIIIQSIIMNKMHHSWKCPNSGRIDHLENMSRIIRSTEWFSVFPQRKWITFFSHLSSKQPNAQSKSIRHRTKSATFGIYRFLIWSEFSVVMAVILAKALHSNAHCFVQRENPKLLVHICFVEFLSWIQCVCFISIDYCIRMELFPEIHWWANVIFNPRALMIRWHCRLLIHQYTFGLRRR